MTKDEARAHFRIKETDHIMPGAVKELLEITENQLKKWRFDRLEATKLEKDIEALKALLR